MSHALHRSVPSPRRPASALRTDTRVPATSGHTPADRRGRISNATCTYAPDGLRRSAHHGGAANPVSFVWDGDDLLNEYRSGGVSCRYDVLDGEVFGERRDGSRYLYVPDPLGSINHLLDTSQTIAGTYVYWPYGEVQSHTGPDTPLQFVGGLGYYTGVVNRTYVGGAGGCAAPLPCRRVCLTAAP
ncbi:MAG: hypothetical protein FJX72_08935 [Armatimonadetes bacterium]|nr:hypothetical protein [Armatimonadota bacterium]